MSELKCDCSKCGAPIVVERNLAGMQVKCRHCEAVFIVKGKPATLERVFEFNFAWKRTEKDFTVRYPFVVKLSDRTSVAVLNKKQLKTLFGRISAIEPADDLHGKYLGLMCQCRDWFALAWAERVTEFMADRIRKIFYASGAGVILLILTYFLGYQPVHDSIYGRIGIFSVLIWIGFVVYCLFRGKRDIGLFPIHSESWAELGVIPFFAFIALLSGPIFFFNGALDSSKVNIRMVEVVGKETETSYRKGRQRSYHYVVVKSWRDPRETVKIPVAASVLANFRSGEVLKVPVQDGFLGIEWIRR